MSLSDLIRGKPRGGLATVTPAISATAATVVCGPVAGIAKVAVANPKAAFAASDDANCRGRVDPECGAAFLPWGPYLSEADVRRLRLELVAMIETLAGVECWPRERRDDVLTRALRGPLADLMPNLAYFRARLVEAQAEVHARELALCRAWRMEGFDGR